MTHSPDVPTLTFYARDGCHLCDEARADLQAVLEDRVKRGEPIARVRVVNIDTQPALRERYNDVIPVMALDGAELPLAMGRRTIDRFLDTASAGSPSRADASLDLTTRRGVDRGHRFVHLAVRPAGRARVPGPDRHRQRRCDGHGHCRADRWPARSRCATSRWRVLPHAIAFVLGFGSGLHAARRDRLRRRPDRCATT